MKSNILSIIQKLERGETLCKEQFVTLLEGCGPEECDYIFKKSKEVANRIFGNEVYMRGLIEFTNICKQDCYYCGIRKSNLNVQRYRLNKDEILECCEIGEKIGFSTFVLQGGEDGWYTDDVMVDIVSAIRKKHPNNAITLSFGERSEECYKRLFDAGANRYLLRHETATSSHYSKLHPPHQTLKSRMSCLESLKKIGFQVGCGFMVGSPYQNISHLAEDLIFLQEFKPHMVGIGPFISHHDTPFANEKNGSLDQTLLLLAIVRLMLPEVLLPATTALGTIEPSGRERGILVGANVVMPNLSPVDVRNKYLLYDNKLSSGAEAAETCQLLSDSLERIGYHLSFSRGDSPQMN